MASNKLISAGLEPVLSHRINDKTVINTPKWLCNYLKKKHFDSQGVIFHGGIILNQ